MPSTVDQQLGYESEKGPTKVAAVLIMRIKDDVPDDRDLSVAHLEFVVAQKDDGTWTFPGGKYAHEIPNEKAIKGAKRELEQETGADLPIKAFSGVGEEMDIELEDGKWIRIKLFVLPYQIAEGLQLERRIASHGEWEYLDLLALDETGDLVVQEILRRVLYVPAHIFEQDLMFHLGFGPRWEYPRSED